MVLVTLTFVIGGERDSAAAPMQSVTTNSAFNGIPVSNTDLLQMPGVVVTTSGYTAFTSGSDSFGNPNPMLKNGSAGGNTSATSDWPNLVFEGSAQDPQYTVDFALDLTGAPLGYNISQIDSFSGWPDSRASQFHNIYYSTVGDPGFVQLLSGLGGGFGNSFGSPQSNVGLRVRVVDATNPFLAVGVDAIRFEMRPGGAGGHVYREIDIFGTPTPEPHTVAIWVTIGVVGFIVSMKRRRHHA
jgi:hypothetical protein